MRGFLVSRSERAAFLALAVAAACGGKAEKDGLGTEAGAPGLPAASGGSAGTSTVPATGGAAPPGCGMMLPPTGGKNTGGSVASGGAAGGMAPATGGAAPRPEPGTEIWFPRGYVSLEDLYPSIVAKLLGVEPPKQDSSFASWRSVHQQATSSTNANIVKWVTDAIASLDDSQLLDALGCMDADARCAEATANAWAGGIWRRPLEASESAPLMEMFSVAAPGSEMSALRDIVRTILSAPEAYIMPALGVEVSPGKYELTDFELAGLLAVGVTGMPPDDELLRRATNGDLELEVEVERLLVSDGSRERVERMIRGWFRIPEPEFLWLNADEPELAESMLGETRYFITDLVFGAELPVSNLLTADFSHIDARLAELYGLSSPATDFDPVNLSNTPRRGIPGQASYLAASSYGLFPSYAARAVIPLLLLCDQLPPAPPGAVPPPTPPGMLTRRQQLEATTSPAACSACHKVMNPLAFAFDHFDGRGAYLEVDRTGVPIDSSGSLTTYAGLTLAFEDSAELMRQIADAPAYSQCFVQTAVTWLVGTDPTGEALKDYVARGHDPGDDERVLEVMRNFLLSDHFRYRKD